MKPYLANNIVAAESVLIHDGDDDGSLPQHMGGHVKGEGLIEDGVETALHHHRLLLLYTLVLVHQPHLHIGICSVEAECGGLHERDDEDAHGDFFFLFFFFRVRFAITLLIVKSQKRQQGSRYLVWAQGQLIPRARKHTNEEVFMEIGPGICTTSSGALWDSVILPATSPTTAGSCNCTRNMPQRAFHSETGHFKN